MQPTKKPRDIGSTLSLPFKSEPKEARSDALEDFHIRFTHWVNYIGEAILMSYIVKNNLPLVDNLKVQLHAGVNPVPSFQTPIIRIENQSQELKRLHTNILQQLFFSSIVQFSTAYEVFLTELIQEILRDNDEWIENEEKPLTAKEVLELRTADRIREKLIDRKTLDFAMLSYPQKVESFERHFHVGLHSKKSPLTLFEVHDFLEVRNVIVHSDGYASSQYLQRMKSYNQQTLLKRKYDTLKIDFSWLLSFAQRVTSLCDFIDGEVGKKWKTSRNIAT
jgi:hypothetical protein